MFERVNGVFGCRTRSVFDNQIPRSHVRISLQTLVCRTAFDEPYDRLKENPLDPTMGRYGVGSGALAIRARAKMKKRCRRHSLQNDSIYTVFENPYARQKGQEGRKNSSASCQSAPGKVPVGTENTLHGGASGEESIIPGQMPPDMETSKSKGLPSVNENVMAGPSWWPGPPLQQGGVVGLLSPSLGNGSVAPVGPPPPSLYGGIMSTEPWHQIQARLLPEISKATKPDRYGNSKNEVG
ncbi:hypothetical protein SK128_020650 [Halocaridina rubra]|uniref:Uncharacterized protein n=1 Tax=Halocaridina rubra TaxID=373956 RepID=A0AAN9AAG4_HALRR